MRHRKMVLSCAAHDKLLEYRPYFGDECLKQKNNVEVRQILIFIDYGP